MCEDCDGAPGDAALAITRSDLQNARALGRGTPVPTILRLSGVSDRDSKPGANRVACRFGEQRWRSEPGRRAGGRWIAFLVFRNEWSEVLDNLGIRKQELERRCAEMRRIWGAPVKQIGWSQNLCRPGSPPTHLASSPVSLPHKSSDPRVGAATAPVPPRRQPSRPGFPFLANRSE